ncbi:MAG: hypothetical protein K6G09_09035 [Treponema sp.]|nr:hypothetical protein [Treponema sp.]
MKKIITHKLNKEQLDTVKTCYGQKYEVLDTECFSDVLAVPALLIFINPNQLSVSEMRQLNEVFRFDTDTIMVFSEYPNSLLLKVLGSDIHESIDNMAYYVAEDLETITMYKTLSGTGEFVSKLAEEVENYPLTVSEKDKLLNEIDDSIMPQDDCPATCRASIIRNRTQIYRHFYELVQFGEIGPSRRKIPYRYELINVLLAFKLAYELAGVDNSISEAFNNPIGIDKGWILELAEQLKKRKDNSRFLSSQYNLRGCIF